MFKKLLDFITGRSSNLEDQIWHLHQMILQDNRWMAHSPEIRVVTDRYLKALSDDWRTQSFESSDALRRRLGLNPHIKASTASQIELLEKELARCSRQYQTKVIDKETYDIVKRVYESRLQELHGYLNNTDQRTDPPLEEVKHDGW